jgi:hypothetical protein
MRCAIALDVGVAQEGPVTPPGGLHGLSPLLLSLPTDSSYACHLSARALGLRPVIPSPLNIAARRLPSIYHAIHILIPLHRINKRRAWRQSHRRSHRSIPLCINRVRCNDHARNPHRRFSRYAMRLRCVLHIRCNRFDVVMRHLRFLHSDTRSNRSSPVRHPLRMTKPVSQYHASIPIQCGIVIAINTPP